jgi:hypothetical protein
MKLPVPSTKLKGMKRNQKYEPNQQFGYTGVNGAAAIMGISLSKLYKLSSACKIKHCKLDGKLIFKISDLLEYIESKRIPIIEK